MSQGQPPAGSRSRAMIATSRSIPVGGRAVAPVSGWGRFGIAGVRSIGFSGEYPHGYRRDRMPGLNRIAGFAAEVTAWRQWMHRNPELGFDLPKTSAFVAERLREFGVDEIHEGIATSGIVAIINGQGEGPTVGLRADMDALP